jgi:hypothetical protein
LCLISKLNCLISLSRYLSPVYPRIGIQYNILAFLLEGDWHRRWATRRMISGNRIGGVQRCLSPATLLFIFPALDLLSIYFFFVPIKNLNSETNNGASTNAKTRTSLYWFHPPAHVVAALQYGAAIGGLGQRSHGCMDLIGRRNPGGRAVAARPPVPVHQWSSVRPSQNRSCLI